MDSSKGTLAPEADARVPSECTHTEGLPSLPFTIPLGTRTLTSGAEENSALPNLGNPEGSVGGNTRCFPAAAAGAEGEADRKDTFLPGVLLPVCVLAPEGAAVAVGGCVGDCCCGCVAAATTAAPAEPSVVLPPRVCAPPRSTLDCSPGLGAAARADVVCVEFAVRRVPFAA